MNISVEQATRPLQVLVVDDNRDAANSLTLLVRLWGHKSTTCYSGQAALEAALASPPDVAILDITMPGMDGLKVAARIRAEIPRGQVFLVAMTGHGEEKAIHQSTEAGFDCHLTKPCEPEILKMLLEGRKAATVGDDTVSV